MNERAPGRGDDTRSRLIEAALAVFSERGYAAATTRDLASRAGANVAAIPYHFGGKKALYLAAAAHVADRIATHMAGPVGEAMEMIGDPAADRSRLLAQLGEVTDAMATLMVGSDEAETWAGFIQREQAHPTEAFDLLYEGAMKNVTRAIAGLCARICGRRPDDPDVALDMFGIMGQLLVFRTSRAAVQRRLGWDDYNGDRLATIQAMVRRNTARLLAPLDGEQP